MQTSSFQRFAAYGAIASGLGGPLYSIAFVVLVVLGVNPGLGLPASALLLALGGLLTTAVMVELHQRLRETEPGFALWALLLGVVGALGSVMHGVFDLANIIHPVSDLPAAVLALPSYVDPRGLSSFGLSGIALLLFAWLMSRSGQFPANLANLGYAAGALYIVLFLGRLILLTPTHPLVAGAAALSGLIINPIWFVWLGRFLLRGGSPATQGRRRKAGASR